MKSVLKWGSLCLFVYLVFLIVKLPAVQVLPRTELYSNISTVGVSGTLWNGHASRLQVNGIAVNDVNWSLSFFPLLLGQINLDIKAGKIRDVEQISINGNVQLSFSGLEIQAEDLLAYIPTDLVISLLPLPIPIQADGRFKVQLDEIAYEAGCQTFKGSGQWLNASYTGTTGVIDLGSFNADLSCDNGSIVADVKQPNRFGLTAKTTIPANMRFKVEGRFKPEANLPKEVHQAAQFFGKADPEGYYPIKF
jgi:general secretion pathway protein N